MKIGLDFHGVIDRYPNIFSKLSRKWQENGHEIHIMTGKEWLPVKEQLNQMSVVWDKAYSIIDHHLALGTPMKKRDNGWWMDEMIWNKSKGEYCQDKKIDLFFDNELRYADFVPETCYFLLVKGNNFEEILSLF